MNNGILLRFLCAAFCAAFLTLPPSASASSIDRDGLFDRLRSGGFVLVMRHAASPQGQADAKGMSEGCQLGQGRGLSMAGKTQAKAIGALFAEENVPLLRAYTSRMCRAWDTAVLAAGSAPVVPHGSQMTTRPEAITAFKKKIADEFAAGPSANILLVSHSNIAPLYGACVGADEEELPEGIVSIVETANWETLARLLPNGDVSACSPLVD